MCLLSASVNQPLRCHVNSALMYGVGLFYSKINSLIKSSLQAFFVQPLCFNRIINARCIPAAITFVKLSWISNRLHAAFMSTELMST